MKLYKRIFKENRIEFKAWYDPKINDLIIFSSDKLHSNVAKELLGLDNNTALRDGYLRIAVTPTEITVESQSIPSDKFFQNVVDRIDFYSHKKVTSAMWEVVPRNLVYLFSGIGFFNSKSIKNAKDIVSYD